MSKCRKLLILSVIAVLVRVLGWSQTPSGQSESPQVAQARTACASDVQKLCAGVQPGGGRIVACLKEHKDSLSDRCKQAAGLPVNPSNSAVPSAASSPAPSSDSDA